MASEQPLIDVGSPTWEGGSVELGKLKKDLEAYRELFLPVNKVLEWEQNYYPAIIVGVITLVFSLVWYVEPSVLTTICLVGILISAIDLAVPALTGVIFSSSDWNDAKEHQYEAICRRLLNAKQHAASIIGYLMKTKQEKPKLYYIGMIGAFACLAWFGCIIDNLFLTYLIVVGLALCPGVRKSGLIDKVSKQATEKIASFKNKDKTN
jgi:hypothetical protein